MFALPNPSALLPLLILTVSIGFAIAIAYIVIHVVASRRQTVSTSDSHLESDTRKCQYCRRSAAALREETVRRDGDDLIDVRCYVCSNCGLPQWWLERRGISPHVR